MATKKYMPFSIYVEHFSLNCFSLWLEEGDIHSRCTVKHKMYG